MDGIITESLSSNAPLVCQSCVQRGNSRKENGFIPIQCLPCYHESSQSKLGMVAQSPPAASSPASPLDSNARSALFTELETKKMVVTTWYLNVCDEAVETFLTRNFPNDYVLRALPDNYIDQPPVSLQAVEHNLSILQHCVQEVFHPQSTLQQQLVKPTVQHVYQDGLLPLQQAIATALASNELTTKERGKVQQWQHHLAAMEELEHSFLADAHGDDSNRRLSDVVPVAGLIVGKLHRDLHEHETAFHHWRR